MCGIAGILHTDGAPVRVDALAAMLAALAHRGPDGGGTSVRGALALGHRRLAIIDPAGGRQPLATADGAIEAVVNGEIYNYRELTAELTAKGHRFATRCDSEVVVHAYAEWGDAGLERLRGMYALAIADHRRGRLLLARDPFGIKPLLWLRQGRRVAFASELQALRTLPDVAWRLDRTAIDQYLQLAYIPAPRTAFQDVHKLEPGQRVAFTCAGGAMEQRRHLPPAFAPDAERPFADWLEEAAATLDESVRAHLVSDVPFGAFLSGGVDSSLVVGAMARALGRPVRTFSIGFADEHGAIDAAHDETRHAEAVARRWGTEHQTGLVTPASFDVLPELVRHHGEPFGDSSAVPTDAVARLARQSVAMVLSGDGADELFAGYDTYRGWWRWLEGAGVHPLRRAARGVASLLAPASFPARRAGAASWLACIAQLGARRRAALWRPELRPAAGVPAAFQAAGALARGAHPVALAQQYDLATYLPGDILTKVDIASMRHGLEVRTPFIDARVHAFAARLPTGANLEQHADGSWSGKRLLKALQLRDQPEAPVQRPKQGFAVPLARWLAPGGALDHLVGAHLGAGDSPLRGLFRPAELERIRVHGPAGPRWLLVVLDEWLRQQPGLAL